MAILVPQTDQPQGDFKPYPEGTYHLKIDSFEEKVHNNGNPQLKLSCTIVGGNYADKGVVLFFFTHAKAAWRVEQLFLALGVQGADTGQTDAEGNPVFAYEPNDLVGAVVQTDAKIRTYDKNDGTKGEANDWKSFKISEYDPQYKEVMAAKAAAAQAPAPQNGQAQVAQQLPAQPAAQMAAPAAPPRRRRGA